MKIRAVIEFDTTGLFEDEEESEMVGIDIDVDNLKGESVQVKTGEYTNLLLGSIISAEVLEE